MSSNLQNQRNARRANPARECELLTACPTYIIGSHLSFGSGTSCIPESSLERKRCALVPTKIEACARSTHVESAIRLRTS
jgi:hypothetical protein